MPKCSSRCPARLAPAQEEAQRLGRVLRPKADGRQAHFYTLVSRDTEEQEFAHHRQLFLTEQGYTYRIIDEAEWSPRSAWQIGTSRRARPPAAQPQRPVLHTNLTLIEVAEPAPR